MRNLIVGAIVFVLGAAIFAVRPQDVVIVTPGSLTVRQNESAPFNAALIHVGWFGRNLTPVAGSVAGRTSPTLLVLDPASGVETPSPGTIKVTGIGVGEGTVTVSGTAATGTVHGSAEVKVKVIRAE